ncbi:MAG: glycosyl hydrolase family 65 protein [Specibacter sp.]
MKLENLSASRGRIGPKGQFEAVVLDVAELRQLPLLTGFLEQLHGSGVPTALVTSCEDCRTEVQACGLAGLVAEVVDRTDAVRLSLPGPPDPAMHLEALHRMRSLPGAAIAVENTPAGVLAATAAGFGLVIGIGAGDFGAQLRAGGAKTLFDTFPELVLPSGPDAGTTAATPAVTDAWTLASHGFDPAEEGWRETLYTLGNGYWGTRGSQPGSVSDGVHCPGTYFAGIYNRRTTMLGSTPMESEHLVNAPDWTFLSVARTDGEIYCPGSGMLRSHDQRLDLHRGTLAIDERYSDGGRTISISSRRFQSQSDPHLAAMETKVLAENWTGSITILSAINTSVSNVNAASDSMLDGRHFLPGTATEPGTGTVVVDVQTNQSGLTISMAARTGVHDRNGDPVAHTSRFVNTGGLFGHEMTLTLAAGEAVFIEKTVAAATSRDHAISTPRLDAAARIARAPAFSSLLRRHADAWQALWTRFAVELSGPTPAALAINVNTFHVLQSVPTTIELDAGVPARGLHGEGYRGHIFWDELFVYPMLTFRRPEITRQLLMYRYRRLEQARAAASAAGFSGAMYPWQSGSSGREETPTELFNTLDGSWMPDHSRLQVHVGLAVAYSVWQYYQSTGDERFLARYGAEMLVEVARFFARIATFDAAADRFDIAGVMGPDEFHDAYPDSPELGIRNNSYTNVLASWVLARAAEALDVLSGLDVHQRPAPWSPTPAELLAWDHISRRLRLHFHADGIISQFDGYEALAEFNWAAYRSKYGNVGRLDLILQAEGDSTNHYQISKQADVLMLFYLFSAEELRSILRRLDYALPPELVRRTVKYFLARTSHGSTLSRLAHSWVLARSDREQSWSLFGEALECDLAVVKGGSTREGVHLGAMAGTVDMAIRCYGGVETRQGELLIHPLLPTELPRVAFQLSYRGQPIDVDLTHDRAILRLHQGSMPPIRVRVEGVRKTLHPGAVFEVELRR